MDSVYKEEILDHYKYPRNQGTLSDPEIDVAETNASCGDVLNLQLKVNKENRITEVKYQCKGCVISTAVSSMISDLIKGKTLKEVRQLTLDDVYQLLGGPVSIGRVKCAGLMLKTLEKGIVAYEKK